MTGFGWAVESIEGCKEGVHTTCFCLSSAWPESHSAESNLLTVALHSVCMPVYALARAGAAGAAGAASCFASMFGSTKIALGTPRYIVSLFLRKVLSDLTF